MKKKFYLCLLFISLLIGRASATHIVGGEFVLQAITDGSGGTHILTMNLYFDALNGNPGAEDFNITVGIFRKKDNVAMDYYTIRQTNTELVPFTNPLCSHPQAISVRLIQYSTNVNLSPARYDDPEGYYIVWDRCCRNNVINNIANPGAVSMVFYLEFPAQKLPDGSLFKNSSPLFDKLVGDFICKDRPFYFNFGATDPDGDSLVYSMTTPNNGFSSTATPRLDRPVGAFSYPKISWISGYNANNAIKGTQPLTVNPRTGQLTVIASDLGLYLFSVLVEEYRNGKRIGVVQRDFQLVVVECLDNNVKPDTKAKTLNNVAYKKDQVLTFKIDDTKKCVNLFTTDPNLTKKMTFQVNQLEGKNKFDYNFTINNSTEIKTIQDTIKSTLCFNSCVNVDGKPVTFEIIAKDDGCPQPLTDTIRVKVLIEGGINNKPQISTDLPNNRGTATAGGNALTFNILGKDIDNDNISIEAIGKGFTLASLGMSFTNTSGKGSITSGFSWSPPCGLVLKDQYEITFVITDNNACSSKKLQDSVKVVLKATSIAGMKPTISTTLTKNVVEVNLTGKNTQPITFNVSSQDPDNDPIKLVFNGINFDPTKYKIQFENKSGIGKLTSPFTWIPTCEDLEGKEQNTFQLRFTTEDNSCLPNKADTVVVQVLLKSAITNFDTQPPNVFTPNGDGKNDYFSMPNLPEDNCTESFEQIVIYNRLGSEVFRSTERAFKWLGTDFPEGIYYYWIKFTTKEFKGTVSLLR